MTEVLTHSSSSSCWFACFWILTAGGAWKLERDGYRMAQSTWGILWFLYSTFGRPSCLFVACSLCRGSDDSILFPRWLSHSSWFWCLLHRLHWLFSQQTLGIGEYVGIGCYSGEEGCQGYLHRLHVISLNPCDQVSSALSLSLVSCWFQAEQTYSLSYWSPSCFGLRQNTKFSKFRFMLFIKKERFHSTRMRMWDPCNKFAYSACLCFSTWRRCAHHSSMILQVPILHTILSHFLFFLILQANLNLSLPQPHAKKLEVSLSSAGHGN